MSIIVPSLNEEKYIGETLKAITNQRADFDYEIFVCDGRSTDRTVKIAKKYARVLISPRRGKVAQMNYAASKAKGGILVFIDADTILPENYLQRMHELFEEDRELLACGSWFKFVGKGLKIKFAGLCMDIYLGLFKSSRGRPELAGCNICVRREAFREIGGFKDVPNEDTELSIALRELAKKRGAGKIKYLRKPKVLVSGRRIEKMGFVNTFACYIRREQERIAPRKKSKGPW